MFRITIIVKLALVFLFNSLEASNNNITSIINDMGHSFDKLKSKYFLIRHDIFSPENSISTNYGIYSDSLTVISIKLRENKYEIFEEIRYLDIEQNHLDKISKIKLKYDSLNNSISVLNTINKYYNTSYKNQLTSFGDYTAQIKRLVTFEKLLSQLE
tara:strand:- start:334 stop:804 length:471 start_codon:yes stop_codon:yes gene_type:complete